MVRKSLQISQIQILMITTNLPFLDQVYTLFLILTTDIIQDNILNTGEIKILSQQRINIHSDRKNGKESEKKKKTYYLRK
jgi:hypothetical protein